MAIDSDLAAGLMTAEEAKARRREIARDAVDAEAVGPVRRDRDLDHRVVPPQHFRRGRAHGEIAFQIDDADMIVGEFELALRTHHAVRLDAADLGRLQHHAVHGDRRAGRCEDARHAGARIRRAAYDLQLLHFAIDKRFDLQDLQLVGVGMGPGFQHFRNREDGKLLRRVFHALDLEAEHGELLDDLVERRIGFERVLQPGKGEFHDESPPASVGTSSAAKP